MLFAFLRGSSWFRGLRRPSAKLQYNFQYRFPHCFARLFPNHAEYDTFCITVSFHRGGKGGNVCCGGRGGIFSACFPFGLLMCRTRLFLFFVFRWCVYPFFPNRFGLFFGHLGRLAFVNGQYGLSHGFHIDFLTHLFYHSHSFAVSHAQCVSCPLAKCFERSIVGCTFCRYGFLCLIFGQFRFTFRAGCITVFLSRHLKGKWRGCGSESG